MSRSEADVADLRQRQIELANEKAQLEDQRVTLESERAALIEQGSSLETVAASLMQCNRSMSDVLVMVVDGFAPGSGLVQQLGDTCNAAEMAVSEYTVSYGSP